MGLFSNIVSSVKNTVKIALNKEDADSIMHAWNEYYGYVRNLNSLNINYNWRKYELARNLYEEWKLQQRK